MTDYQHDEPRTENDVPFLTGSSEPTGEAPTFEPTATAPAKTADEALDALAREVSGLAQRERAAYAALADLEPTDTRQDTLTYKAKDLEASIVGRLTMASVIRADTHAGLAAKGRSVLAYRETLDHCQVPEVQSLLISMAEDAVRLNGGAPQQLWATQDAAVIHAANEVRRLSAENDAIWGADPELADDDPAQIDWKAKADAVDDSFQEAVAHLATLRPQTAGGMSAKASAAPALTSLSDFVKDWPEYDLMLSIAADAQRIGAGLASTSVPSRAGTDQPQVEQAA